MRTATCIAAATPLSDHTAGRTIGGHGIAPARSAAPIRRPHAGHDLGRDRRPVHGHRSSVPRGGRSRSRATTMRCSCSTTCPRAPSSSTRWSSTASACGRRRASPTVRRARSAPARASIRRAWRSDPVGWAHPSASRTRCRPSRIPRGSGWTRSGHTPAVCSAGIEPWPDWLLLIGDQVYADEVSPRDGGVHSRPPRRVAAAGRGDRGLRGVHAALPRVVERSRHPLAALDRAQRDGVRRPRRDRRLEHLVGVDRGRAQRTVVGRPDHRGVHVVLDLSASRATWRRRSSPRSRCSLVPPPGRTSVRRFERPPTRPTATRRPRGGPAFATSVGRGCWSSTRAPRVCSPMGPGHGRRR